MRKISRRYYFHGVQAQNAKKPPGNFFDSVLAVLGSLSELCLDIINILCSSAPSDVTDHMTDNTMRNLILCTRYIHRHYYHFSLIVICAHFIVALLAP